MSPKELAASPLRVAILGAGALGQAYCDALERGGASVTLVVRTLKDSSARQVERRSRPRGIRTLQASLATEIPSDVDVVLVAIRGDQVNAEVIARLRAAQTHARIVFLTPTLPPLDGELDAALPGRVTAMATLVAEFEAGHAYYWSAVPTLIDRPALLDARVARLAATLSRGGAAVRARSNLSRFAAASVIGFLPLQLALLQQPNIAAWSRVQGLLPALSVALRSARRLASALGPWDIGLRILMALLSFTWFARLASRVLPRVAPNLCGYLGRHFGEKLRAQHTLLYAQVAALGHQHQVPQDYPARLRP